MKGLIAFLIAGLTFFDVGSLIFIVAIGKFYHPFTCKDYIRDFLRILSDWRKNNC